MNGNPTELLAHHFTLAGVDASADLDVEALERLGNGSAATYRASWSVEGRKKTIACGIDLATAMTLKLLAHEEVVNG